MKRRHGLLAGVCSGITALVILMTVALAGAGTTTAVAASSCTATLSAAETWGDRFNLHVAVTGSDTWTVTLGLKPRQSLQNSWNAKVTASGSTITATPSGAGNNFGVTIMNGGGSNTDWPTVSCTIPGTTTPPTTPPPTTPPPSGTAQLKPRIVIMTDITSANWEPDDLQSLIHVLAGADMYQIDGIVSTTGWSLDGSSPLQTSHIHDVINAYAKDLPRLMKRSGQTGFLSDESRQKIGYWPSPDYLRGVVREGLNVRGMGGVGSGKDSAGSNHVINVVDRSDPRPVWVTFWGSGNTLAQALWRVQNTRSAAELNQFVSKVRVYAITDQDRGYTGEGYANSSQAWMRKTFRNLFYIWAESAWGEYGSKIKSSYWSQYTSKIQGRGSLGGLYPTWKYIVEGDSPSWLHLWPGLNDPGDPSQYGFGGRFVYGTGPDGQTQAYVDNSGDAANQSRAAVNRTLQDQTNDFISRIDWATNGTGNRNPRAVVNGDSGYAPVTVDVSRGTSVTLSADGTTDPDGNTVGYGWTQDTGAGYSGTVGLSGANTRSVTVQVPSDAAGKTIHLVLRAADNGSPVLASYRRVVLRVG